jgi:hypothetical protein
MSFTSQLGTIKSRLGAMVLGAIYPGQPDIELPTTAAVASYSARGAAKPYVSKASVQPYDAKVTVT